MAAASSSFSFVSFAKIIEELETRWSINMDEGLQFFDKICQNIEDDGKRREAAKIVANKIRTASLFRKFSIFEDLTKTSLMCRIYLSHEFRSVRDPNFPRMRVFYEKSQLVPTPMIVQPAHSYVAVFGNNQHFNLGVPNGAKEVEEARIIKVPQCRKIKMSHSHTLLMTHDGRAFGCGKSSLLAIGDEVMTDEYLKEPTLLKIPSDEFVEDIVALDDGSIIATDKFVYVVGKAAIERCKYKALESASLLDDDFDELPAGIIKRQCGFLLDFKISKHEIFNEKLTTLRIERGKTRLCYPTALWFAKFSTIRLTVLNEEVKIYLQHRNQGLFYSFKSVGLRHKECLLILDGKCVRNANVEECFTSSDGKITMKLDSGILVEGRVEIVHQKVGVKWSDEADSLRLDRRRVVAIVNEIPGSYGTDIFCCSPDGQSCIFQIGKTESKLMRSFEDDLLYTEKMRVIQDYRESFKAESTMLGSLYWTRLILNRVSFYWQRKPRLFPRKNSFVIALSMLQDLLINFIGTNEYFEVNQVRRPRKLKCEKYSISSDWSNAETMDFVTKKMEETEIEHPQFGCDFLVNIEIGLQDHILQHSLSNREARRFFQFAGLLARLVEHYFIEDYIRVQEEMKKGEIVEDKNQLQTLKFDLPRNSLKTQNIEEIVSNRIKIGELHPDDIPIDLKITVASNTDEPRYLTGSTNQTIFELMHPNWARNIENGHFHFTDNWAHNYFYHRADLLAVGKSQNWDCSFPDAVRRPVKFTSEKEVLCRLEPKNPITNFITPITSDKDIYYLESLDGNRVPVHRSLFLLHSRLISAKQSFDSTQRGTSDSGSLEPMVFKTFVTTEVIENSIKALLDMTTLYDKNIEEAVDVLMFFDFYVMLEAVQDALEIIFQMFNDSNLDILYWLFDKMESQMTPLLLKHNRLILMSASEHIPPRDFIKRFCQLLSDSPSAPKRKISSPRARYIIYLVAEDAMKLLINLPEDLDKSLLEAFEEEWNVDYRPVLEKKGLSVGGNLDFPNF